VVRQPDRTLNIWQCDRTWWPHASDAAQDIINYSYPLRPYMMYRISTRATYRAPGLNITVQFWAIKEQDRHQIQDKSPFQAKLSEASSTLACTASIQYNNSSCERRVLYSAQTTRKSLCPPRLIHLTEHMRLSPFNQRTTLTSTKYTYCTVPIWYNSNTFQVFPDTIKYWLLRQASLWIYWLWGSFST
jgi:hypothetical protein